jgi:hypothetical protein
MKPFHGWSLLGVSALLLSATVLLSGCEPQLDPNEYGETIYTVPRVEGSDKPYPLPQLDEPTAESAENEPSHTEPGSPQAEAPTTEEK